MSSVELLSNPSPHVSSHRWIASGVDKLTRLNKISSDAFYVPNDTMKTHQFRFVLLKGIEPAADPAEDTLALVVEYIAPRDDTSDARAPRGCSITVSAVAVDSLDESEYHSRVDSFVSERAGGNHSLDAANSTDASWCKTEVSFLTSEYPQVCFPDFLAPRSLELFTQQHHTGETQVAVLVAITTGVNVLTEGVANRAYSLWSSLSSSVADWMKQSRHIYNQQREEFSMIPLTTYLVPGLDGNSNFDAASGSAQDSSSTHLRDNYAGGGSNTCDPSSGSPVVLPWDEIPPAWQNQSSLHTNAVTTTTTASSASDTNERGDSTRDEMTAHASDGLRGETWRHLVRDRIVEDDGTFLYGADRDVSADARAFLLRTGISLHKLLELHKHVTQRPEHAIRLSRELMKQHPVMHRKRYELVPSRVTKQAFWLNYLWKVACLAVCENDSQVRAVITVLNAPPLERRAASYPNSALDENRDDEEKAKSAAAVSDAQEGLALLRESLRDWNGLEDVELVEAAVHACRQHAHRLHELHTRAGAAPSPEVSETLTALHECMARYETLHRQTTEEASMDDGRAEGEGRDEDVNGQDHARNSEKVEEENTRRDDADGRAQNVRHAVGEMNGAPLQTEPPASDAEPGAPVAVAASHDEGGGLSASAHSSEDHSAQKDMVHDTQPVGEDGSSDAHMERSHDVAPTVTEAHAAEEKVNVAKPMADSVSLMNEDDVDFPKMPWEDE